VTELVLNTICGLRCLQWLIAIEMTVANKIKARVSGVTTFLLEYLFIRTIPIVLKTKKNNNLIATSDIFSS
jgi:hypothetical protein